MKLPIPGPAGFFQAAGAVRNGVEDALALLPRLVTVVGQVESVLDRVEAVVNRVESLVDRIETTDARVDSLLELYQPPLTTLAPSVRRFTEHLEHVEVSAMIGLVDRLPRLLTHLDEDVFPILTTLDRVAPDLHQLLEITQDLQVAIGGLPGLGWLRKRAEKEEAEAQEHAREIQAATLKPLGKPKVQPKRTANS
ncbi:MAG: hypothetical protein H0T54_04870 [Geodermatophilaceae bacterium]|nr:hypothetical protein [Geodermatophilaceae bacterium]